MPNNMNGPGSWVAAAAPESQRQVAGTGSEHRRDAYLAMSGRGAIVATSAVALLSLGALVKGWLPAAVITGGITLALLLGLVHDARTRNAGRRG